jgi:anhydro-N-acetylmuramic acid kinase
MGGCKKNYPGKLYDKDAAIAKKGSVIHSLLKALKEHPFFNLPFPRTTGPELFSAEYIERSIRKACTNDPGPEDVMATLNVFTASVICDSLQKIPRSENPLEILLSGGGMHNPLVTDYIKENNPDALISSTAEKNIDPDAKEAILFALLANECVAGHKDTFKNYFPNISMGKISFPG